MYCYYYIIFFLICPTFSINRLYQKCINFKDTKVIEGRSFWESMRKISFKINYYTIIIKSQIQMISINKNGGASAAPPCRLKFHFVLRSLKGSYDRSI